MNKDLSRQVIFTDASEALLLSYFFSDSERTESFRNFLTEKRHRIKSTGQTYRAINHWSSIGLIDDDRKEEESGWRSFNVLQLVWIKAVQKMREFGLPIEMIQKAKKSFYFDRSDSLIKSVFEFYVLRCFLGHKAQMLIFDDGTACIGSEEEVHASQEMHNLTHHITINVFELVGELFPKLDIEFEHVSGLRDDEVELLLFIRANDFETIEVKRKNGSIEMIQGTEQVDRQKRLIEVLKEADYQDISVKSQEGKVVSIRRTLKKKIAPTLNKRGSSTKRSRSSDKRKSSVGTSNATP